MAACNDLFHAALEHPDDARETFLRDACGSDDAQYAEIVSLIAADEAQAHLALERLGEVVAADWAA